MAARKKKTPSASEAVDEQLARYRAMRDFSVTAEPSGASSTADPVHLPFVIQKHAATRLHYDFRLGWKGVLKSWAVAKGPSYYTGDKRLAVEVEDHPMEYGGFEGTIPRGQYGGGTVMIWDQGWWLPHGDAEEGFRTGRLKFELHGQKLRGNWTLVRMGGRAAEEAKPNWLLIKEHDEYERPADATPITEEAPDSVVTGRGLESIAAAEDHVWQSKPSANAARPPRNHSRLALALQQKHAEAKASPARAAELADAPAAPMPEFVEPQLASPAERPPAGEGWLHELKLDGYRVQIHLAERDGRRTATLYTRNGLDWTHRMPVVAAAATHLPVQNAVLDGEVVVLNEGGGTSFADLQASFEKGANHPLTYFAFDLLYLDGHDLRGLPLARRKHLLEQVLRGAPEALRYSEHVASDADQTLRNACELGAEGIVSKKANARYASGRTRGWLKLKCIRQQEFVVGGFTLPSDGSYGIGSLLLGYYEGAKLIYAGRTGTGFNRTTHKSLRDRLEPLRAPKQTFDSIPAEGRRDAIWVRPVLVAEVRFATWTAEHLVRQAAFLGLREDKVARDVVREDAKPPAPRRSRTRAAKDAPESAGSPDHSPAAEALAAPALKRRGKDESEVAGVRITHPDKLLDEETKLTKRQLAEYYAAVAPHLLPHISGRPLSIVRCPEGSGKPCFFQKHTGFGLPKGVESIPVRDKKGGPPEQYITIATPEGLIGLAQMGVLEVHPWGSRSAALERPDRLIFDLDPDEAIGWQQLVASAEEVRSVLGRIGLKSFVKSTGGKGLHVVAPIEPDYVWPEIKAFSRGIALALEDEKPEVYLIKMSKAARKGRIFLDYLRNERGATAVAPWSPRARAGARVAVPLTWRELPKAKPAEFSAASFQNWKARLKKDPWTGMLETRQKIDPGILETMVAAQRKRA